MQHLFCTKDDSCLSTAAERSAQANQHKHLRASLEVSKRITWLEILKKLANGNTLGLQKLPMLLPRGIQMNFYKSLEIKIFIYKTHNFLLKTDISNNYLKTMNNVTRCSFYLQYDHNSFNRYSLCKIQKFLFITHH